MITAKEAREINNNMEYFFNDIEKEIKTAARKGKTEIIYTVLMLEHKEPIKEELTKLGYIVQDGSWMDNIIIKWKGEEE